MPRRPKPGERYQGETKFSSRGSTGPPQMGKVTAVREHVRRVSIAPEKEAIHDELLAVRREKKHILSAGEMKTRQARLEREEAGLREVEDFLERVRPTVELTREEKTLSGIEEFEEDLDPKRGHIVQTYRPRDIDTGAPAQIISVLETPSGEVETLTRPASPLEPAFKGTQSGTFRLKRKAR